MFVERVEGIKRSLGDWNAASSQLPINLRDLCKFELDVQLSIKWRISKEDILNIR